jgi:hypothetical protein
VPGIDALLCILPSRIIDYLRAIANAKFFMQYCRSLHAHGQLSNKVASRPSYTCSLRNCPALAGSMFQERGKDLLLLSPAQPLSQLDQHDGPSLPKVNPLTPAATPVPNWDSRVLPSWPDAGHGIWMPNKLDTYYISRTRISGRPWGNPGLPLFPRFSLPCTNAPEGPWHAQPLSFSRNRLFP